MCTRILYSYSMPLGSQEHVVCATEFDLLFLFHNSCRGTKTMTIIMKRREY
uniref:Uncharacterized protein n=1 Tax=Triticum urartu TaxID=4572 RepID=A0A8R7QJB7_TRIUA